MAINTKKVIGRRTLYFKNLDEIIEEAERLNAVEVRSLGNWSYAQIMSHLAKTMDLSIDGTDFVPSWAVRFFGKRKKHYAIHAPMKPGIKLPDKLAQATAPDKKSMSMDEGFELLKGAIERLKNDPNRAAHPIFGELTRDEWDKLHQRHAELHLSFIVPVRQS